MCVFHNFSAFTYVCCMAKPSEKTTINIQKLLHFVSCFQARFIYKTIKFSIDHFTRAIFCFVRCLLNFYPSNHNTHSFHGLCVMRMSKNKEGPSVYHNRLTSNILQRAFSEGAISTP